MSTAQSSAKYLKGATGDWEIVVGMEIHAQVNSRSKLFSGASTEFGGEENSHVSLVDAAIAGHAAGHQRGVRTPGGSHRAGPEGADQLNSRCFDRKNYFYPDLPQRLPDQPVPAARLWARARSRWMSRQTGTDHSSAASSGIHLEQDAGQVDPRSVGRRIRAFVDLNRSGVALMEIVSRPDIRSPEEAESVPEEAAFNLVRYLGTCDGNMDEGEPACRRERLRAPAGRRSGARAARSRT